MMKRRDTGRLFCGIGENRSDGCPDRGPGRSGELLIVRIPYGGFVLCGIMAVEAH
jgi:hypothetical protein